jgi:hypothetical protein
MELFIRIKDGQPFEHPILGDNFCQAFPNVDTNNLPAEFARFVRVAPPVVGVYENYTGVTYELIDGVYTDVHHVVPMTEQQKTDKQNAVKTDWVTKNGYASWVFDEALCRFLPPIPRPDDGKPYFWDEPTTSWVEVTNA